MAAATKAAPCIEGSADPGQGPDPTTLERAMKPLHVALAAIVAVAVPALAFDVD